MSYGCEPWKLMVSALVLAGSGYHFLDKYLVSPAGQKKVDELGKASKCPPEGCKCVEDRCPRPLTKEQMEELCETFKEKEIQRRTKIREEMEKAVAEKWKKKQQRFGYAKRDPNRPSTV